MPRRTPDIKRDFPVPVAESDGRPPRTPRVPRSSFTDARPEPNHHDGSTASGSMVLRSLVPFGLLGRRSGITVLAMRFTMFRVFSVALEKLAGLAPLVLLAGSDEHTGKGEKDGNNLGLHVGAGRLASLPAGARRR